MQEAAEKKTSLNQGQILREFSLDLRGGRENFEEVVQGAYQQIREQDWRLAVDLFELVNGDKRKKEFVVEEMFFTNPRAGFEKFRDAINSKLREFRSNFEVEGWNVLRLQISAGPGPLKKPNQRLEAEIFRPTGSEFWSGRVVEWRLDIEGNPVSGKLIESFDEAALGSAFSTVSLGVEQVLDRYRDKLPAEEPR
ncbi:hypothetical protein GWM83_04075 [Candidatus Bathyarchaeota archaeon]|nr:hypothetical protein [Candidatus Bathyarchaeota archaeon]